MNSGAFGAAIRFRFTPGPADIPQTVRRFDARVPKDYNGTINATTGLAKYFRMSVGVRKFSPLQMMSDAGPGTGDRHARD